MSSTVPDAVEECATVLVPPGPVDLGLTLGIIGRGPSDPTVRIARTGAALATRTSSGPATLVMRPIEGSVHVTGFGPGAAEVVGRAAALLGGDDEPGAFVTANPLVTTLASRLRGLRLTAGANPVELAMRAVVEQ